MCSMYWTLTTITPCRRCGKPFENELQTHFMGQPGSCANVYTLGQVVPELRGMSGSVLTEFSGDAFCPCCASVAEDGGFWDDDDFGAEIVNGAVVRVWPIVLAEATP